MADSKLVDLTSGAPAAGTDIVYAVKDPSGTPTDAKLALSDVKDYILSLANTWTATQTIDPADNTSALAVTGFSLTGSNAQSLLGLAGTWNTSGTPTGIKLNVTDTASNAASLLMDLQVGGTSQARVSKSGIISVAGLAPATGSTMSVAANIAFTGGSNLGFDFNIYTGATTVGSSRALMGNGFIVGSAFGYNFSSTSGANGTGDLFLTRRAAANLRLGAADAASPVAQTLSVQSVVAGTSNTAGANLTITGSQGTGSGAGGSIIFQVAPAGSSGTSQNSLVTFLEATSARAFNLYNTADVTTNYERGVLRWDNNGFEIGTEAGGTGSARNLRLRAGGVNRFLISGSTGDFLPVTDGTGSIGASGQAINSVYLTASIFQGSGFHEFTERASTVAPSANKVRIYAEDDGSGKTRLMALFATGAAQQIAIEP